jgi:2-methylisocitrate lyase-like PEP mutase family enzyme
MSEDWAERRARFRALHREGCFVLPNPWDAGSARRLEKLGFKALASTSAGAAWALGREDGQLGLEDALEHLAMLCRATTLPVNADFENGFADRPDDVAANVARALETGIAGLSIEDWSGSALYEENLARERIAAARATIDESGGGVLLVGRCEAHLHGPAEPATVIRRLLAYAEAGAECLYAPGIADRGAIAELVAAVAPKPVNVLLRPPSMSVGALAELGVRRVSVGGTLAALAWAAFHRAAHQLLESGTLPPRG